VEEKQGFWARLSDRERRLLVVWALAMSFIVVFLGGYFAFSAIDEKEEKAQQYAAAVDLMTRKQGEYLARKAGGGEKLSDRIAGNQLKLQTFLDQEAAKHNIKIKNFKESAVPVGGKRRKKDAKGPQVIEETVAIDLTDTEYGNVVGFLDAIDRSPELVIIKRIDVARPRRNDGPTVRVALTVSTFKLGTGS
jgi:hypothetical protein